MFGAERVRWVKVRQRTAAWSYAAARYYAAFTLMGYGFAKVMGAQFTVLDSELAKPMGDVSGFWLTWYYFGYSPIYSALVAWAQIAGAVLLCFRRTALIGTLLLVPIMVNIVFIDLWVVRFPLESGALRNAIYVLLALLIVLIFHKTDLLQLLAGTREDLAVFGSGRWRGIATGVIVLGMIGYTAHRGYWLANVNNRDPTSLDGAWEVQEPSSAGMPSWIYFEYNRAYMAVFRYPDGRSEVHDFRVDEASRSIQIGQDWLTPGADIFKGNWSRSGDTLTVDGDWKGDEKVHLSLHRKRMQVRDHR